MVDCVNFANIEVSSPIKIYIPTVVALNLGHAFAFVKDFTFEVFLGSTLDIADLVVGINVVFLIVELNLTMDPLIQVSHQRVIKSIRGVVKCNFLSIPELDGFVSAGCADSGVDISLHTVLVPAVDKVLFVRPFDVDVRPWRMMASLLNIEVGTISTFTLVCLSEHWVQWLLEAVILPKEGDSRGHDNFHALNWV